MGNEVDEEDLDTSLQSNPLSSKPILMCFEQSFTSPVESYDESIETLTLPMFSGFVFDPDFFKIEASSPEIDNKRIMKKNLNLLAQKKSLSLSILVTLKESTNHHVCSYELEEFKKAISNKIKVFRLFK